MPALVAGFFMRGRMPQRQLRFREPHTVNDGDCKEYENGNDHAKQDGGGKVHGKTLVKVFRF